MVAERQVALAFADRLDLGPVVALGLACEIGLEVLQPGFGAVAAVMGDHRSDQRHLIDMGAAAGTYAAFPFRIGQLLIG